jgi:zinc protease
VWGSSHPYGRPVGTREVAQATKAEACAFIDRYYTPKRAILVIVGNFDPDAMQPRIGRRFGPITRTSDAPKFLDPIAPARLAGTRSKHSGDVEHPTAVIVLPAPPWGSPDEAKSTTPRLPPRAASWPALDDRPTGSSTSAWATAATATSARR